MSSRTDRASRAFFTALALVVVFVPLLALASSRGLQWGDVPEWIAAVALLIIGGGVWKIARIIELQRRDSHRNS